MTVSDVAGDNLDLVQSRNILQPAPEIERIILGQRCYARFGAHQMFDQVGADESISPRFHFRSPTGPSSGSLDNLCAPIARSASPHRGDHAHESPDAFSISVRS